LVRVVSLVSIRYSPWSIHLLPRAAPRLCRFRQYRFRAVQVHGADDGIALTSARGNRAQAGE